MRDGKVVTTTLASQADAAEVAQACAERGEDLLYLGFSSGISGTYGACSAAIAEVAAQHPERKMYSVDTRAASAGQGLLITYVARMRDEGKTIEECRDWAEEHRLNICHWFTVDDLMFLKRGGRVSAVSAVFGTALAIKPVMHMDDDGTLKVVSKARGRKKAIAALADHFGNSLAAMDPADQTVYISHGDCLEDAEELAEIAEGALRDQRPPHHLRRPRYRCALGPRHVGPVLLRYGGEPLERFEKAPAQGGQRRGVLRHISLWPTRCRTLFKML